MKRRAEGEEGVRDATAATAGKRAKKSGGGGGGGGNPVGDLPASTSPPEVLVHKNRELAVLARRLRGRLKAAKARAAELERVRDSCDATLSSVQRAMQEFAKGAGLLLGEFKVDLEDLVAEELRGDEAAAAKQGGGGGGDAALTLRLLRGGLHTLLLKKVTAGVPEQPPGEDDEDDNGSDAGEADRGGPAALARLPASADKALKRHVALLLCALRAVAQRLLGKSELEQQAALKRLVAAADAPERLSRAEARCALFADRVAALEAQVRRITAEHEDAVTKRDVMFRRLAAVCSNALSTAQVSSMCEKMGIKSEAGATAAGSGTSGADGAASAAAAQPQAAGAAADEGSEEAAEAAKLAKDRLEEIERHVAEKKALIDELEALRKKVSEQAEGGGAAPAAGAAAVDPATLDARVKSETAKLHAEVERMQQERDAAEKRVAEAKRAFDDLQAAASKAQADREMAHATALDEMTTKAGVLRAKLDSARADAKNLSRRQAKADEYKQLMEAAQERASKLDAEVKRLTDSPAAMEYRAKLEAALKKEWPGADSDKVDKAMLEADLEASKKELKGNEEYSEELINEIQSVTEALAKMEEQNKRLLKQIEEKETQASRWSTKVLDMGEQLNKHRNQLKLARQQFEEERRLRSTADSEYGALQEQCTALQHALRQAEDLAHQTRAGNAQTATEAERLRAKVAELEAREKASEERAAELEKRCAAFRKEKEDAVFAKARAEEKRKSSQRKLERSRSSIPPMGSGGGDLRGESMENALRCPLRSEYWKDAIITKCSHMFSRKALEDNLAKRNRKCPTCKKLYSKDDIRDVYLYQSNDYDD